MRPQVVQPTQSVSQGVPGLEVAQKVAVALWGQEGAALLLIVIERSR
jgi:hypothetical protein